VTDPPEFRLGRRIHGIAAVLLPFDAGGGIDLDGLAVLVRRATEAGLEVAVNMDTGFGPELTPDERLVVLRATREVLGPEATFVAGAMPFGHGVDAEDAYRREVAAIVEIGAVPVVFPSDALTALGPEELVDYIARVSAAAPRAIAFELGGMFATFGRLFGPEVARRLMAVPNIVGLKHSSLDRQLEWELLRIRDDERPDFQIFTGNDLAIDMVCYGSDYLLGLATFDVVAFAQRDRWWTAGDSRFRVLNDALQAVGDVAFRDPVPAYKHDAALYLKLTEQLEDPHPHPACPRRPSDEAGRLRELADAVAEVMATTR
jgi:dihydrodipicolinate synthase/N-acetylneuraminate lyase